MESGDFDQLENLVSKNGMATYVNRQITECTDLQRKLEAARRGGQEAIERQYTEQQMLNRAKLLDALRARDKVVRKVEEAMEELELMEQKITQKVRIYETSIEKKKAQVEESRGVLERLEEAEAKLLAKVMQGANEMAIDKPSSATERTEIMFLKRL